MCPHIAPQAPAGGRSHAQVLLQRHPRTALQGAWGSTASCLPQPTWERAQARPCTRKRRERPHLPELWRAPRLDRAAHPSPRLALLAEVPGAIKHLGKMRRRECQHPPWSRRFVGGGKQKSHAQPLPEEPR